MSTRLVTLFEDVDVTDPAGVKLCAWDVDGRIYATARGRRDSLVDYVQGAMLAMGFITTGLTKLPDLLRVGEPGVRNPGDWMVDGQLDLVGGAGSPAFVAEMLGEMARLRYCATRAQADARTVSGLASERGTQLVQERAEHKRTKVRWQEEIETLQGRIATLIRLIEAKGFTVRCSADGTPVNVLEPGREA